MSQHKATISWSFSGEDFSKGKFSRAHTWSFDGGVTVPASAAPGVVPAPYSVAANVDPEEAFVASLASCHMLTFLFVAYRKGFKVERYDDAAVGVMSKNAEGELWISEVTLNPQITYGGDRLPTPEDETQLHDGAHHHCFIANSVKTKITVNRG
jgi:organic hydroperoxide reductase OsmC/OhrA